MPTKKEAKKKKTSKSLEKSSKTITPKPNKLTQKQELFCQYFVCNIECYWNWVKAYAMAYWLDANDKWQNHTARNWAYRMMTNDDILKRMREIQTDFLSNEVVDKELTFVVLQRVDLATKMRWISEYNKLNQRIIDKMEVKWDFSLSSQLDLVEGKINEDKKENNKT